MRHPEPILTESAPTPNRQHFDFLDGLRGLAVAMVFVYHALFAAYQQATLHWGDWFPLWAKNLPILPYYPATLGRYGVAVFFVVSGFCIHLSYVRQPGWGPFWIRRFFRIYPPYLVPMLLLGILEPLRLRHSLGIDEGIQLISHLLLVHNFSGFTLFGINGSLWTIAVEVQLYALYPVLRKLVMRWGWQTTLMSLGLVELGLRIAEGTLSTVHNQSLPVGLIHSPIAFWFSWSTGAYAADVLLRGHRFTVSNTLFITLAGIALLADLFKPAESLGFPAVACLTSVLCIRLAQTQAKSSAHKRPPSLWMRHLCRAGVYSYSIYLLHQPILQRMPTLARWVVGASPHLQIWAWTFGLLAWMPVFIISGTFYRYCEQPSLRWGRHVLERYRGKTNL